MFLLFLITLVVVALCSCGMPACSLDTFFRLFNSIGENADADGISEGLAIGDLADGPMDCQIRYPKTQVNS